MARTAVTLVVEHCVANAGAKGRYETWLREIIPLARAFSGHQGIDIMWPGPGSTRYRLVLRFDGMEHLRAWVDSPERAALVARIEPWLEAETCHATSGLEYLFATSPDPPPRRYKQFFLTLSAIYPLTTIVPATIMPLLKSTPWLGSDWSSDLIVSGIIVFLMVYIIMPRYARLFAGWLDT